MVFGWLKSKSKKTKQTPAEITSPEMQKELLQQTVSEVFQEGFTEIRSEILEEAAHYTPFEKNSEIPADFIPGITSPVPSYAEPAETFGKRKPKSGKPPKIKKIKIKKKHGVLLNIFSAIAFFILVFVGTFFVWLTDGPRSINVLTPYIESALVPPGSPYKIHIEDSVVSWEGWQHPVGVNIKNIEIINDKSEIIAYFPEIGISMYLHKLLIGEIDIKSLEIYHSDILLIQNDDGSFSFGLNESDSAANNSIAAALTMLASDDSSNIISRLKSFVVKHATLSVKNKRSGVFLKSSDASLEIVRKSDGVVGVIILPILANNKTGQINAALHLVKASQSVTAKVVYKDIPTSVLHELFPAQDWMMGVKLPLSGSANITSDLNANVEKIDFSLEAGEGVVEYPEQFKEPLNLQHIQFDGSLTDKLSTLTIKQGKIAIKDGNAKPIELSMNGIIHKEGDEYSIDGSAETSNISSEEVGKYWPIKVSPHSREWVTTHISNGIITDAKVTAHFKPGDIKLKDTPDEDIAATIGVKNATVKYLPDHPPVTEVDGVVEFTGESMNAKITSAKYMTDTHITKAEVQMPDMVPDDVRMFMDVDMNGPARDTAMFLALPDINKAKKLNITEDVTGQVTGNALLNFIAFSSDDTNSKLNKENINYAVTAKTSNVSQRNFLGNRDIENANMNIILNNKGIKVLGSSKVNGLPVDIDLYSSFGKGSETTYSVKTDMPVDQMHKFNMPMLDFAKGVIGVNAKFVDKDDSEVVDAALDLTNTDISLPEYGFAKKSGDKATLNMKTESMSSGNIMLKSFVLNGAGAHASGNGELQKNNGDIIALNMDDLRYGNNDLNYLYYRRNAHGFALAVKGNSFDVSPYLNKPVNNSDEPGYNVDIKTDRLVLGDKREIKSVTARADCDKICNAVNLNAKLSTGADFTYSIAAGKLNAATDDAGELLRTLGVINNIFGGKLKLEGEYKDTQIAGVMTMNDYTLKNAPLFTKIFTIASLTGVVDTLAGNGITFSKLTAPYVYSRGVIVLKDAKTHGPALGITADGSVDLNSSTLNLNGVLVPSYTMNSLLGNVPLIGNLLMGGKGQGIIALNYSVKGNSNDPSISANPLSVLTPGFLRGIFDMFDEPAPDIDKITAAQKKAEEQKRNSTLPSLDTLKQQ